MADKIASIDDYLDGVNPEFRRELERIREIVNHLVPGLEETISYRMSTLKYKGRALVYFTASKKHMSFYPSSWAIVELKDRLDGYKTTAHAVQFTLENPLPKELIEDLVRVHVRQIDSELN